MDCSQVFHAFLKIELSLFRELLYFVVECILQKIDMVDGGMRDMVSQWDSTPHCHSVKKLSAP
jgi:hypothetical protein